MRDFKNICEQVCEVARRAGGFIEGERKNFSPDKIEFKGVHNLVTYVDRQTEAIIVEGLRELVDGAGFITEEQTVATAEADTRFKWIIDPLDGTTNFVHGLSPYCVSIALMDGNETVLGVVYEVTHREMFCAWEGSAAFLNGQRITASAVKELSNSLIAIGFSYSPLRADRAYLDKLAWYQQNSDGIRRIGSATADLIYVACGRVDVFFQTNLAAWDVAAGAFIAERAGAVVSDHSGGRDFVFGKQIVAAAPAVYDEFMKTI